MADGFTWKPNHQKIASLTAKLTGQLVSILRDKYERTPTIDEALSLVLALKLQADVAMDVLRKHGCDMEDVKKFISGTHVVAVSIEDVLPEQRGPHGGDA